MLKKPKISPWGEVDTCDLVCPGVFMVYADKLGGIMVSKDISAVLSPAARKCGTRHGGYICFEEESGEAVVFRELLDKKLWDIPDRIKDKAAYEETRINGILREHYPEYMRSWHRGRETTQPRPVPAHCAEL